MAECDICSMIEAKDAFKVIYEDDRVFVVLHESPAVLGHTLVIPKKHYTILEEVPDELVSYLFSVANRISMILFEATGAQGTNIIVNNGSAAGQEMPHFMINVIPRKEGDNLKLDWKPNKRDSSSLDSTLAALRSKISAADKDYESVKVVPKEPEKPIPAAAPAPVEELDEDEEDYRAKQLIRMP